MGKIIEKFTLTKLPMSTASNTTYASPTASLSYTHYYKDNGNRKERRIAAKRERNART